MHALEALINEKRPRIKLTFAEEFVKCKEFMTMNNAYDPPTVEEILVDTESTFLSPGVAGQSSINAWDDGGDTEEEVFM